MKLYISSGSPFARKARIFVELCQLQNQVEMITTTFDDETLRKVNPLSKIPTLVDADLNLIDSPLICEYFDTKFVEAGGKSFFCKGSSDYFQIQKQHALANGILEATVSSVLETRRNTEQSQAWLERWKTAIKTAIENIDLNYAGDAKNINVATIALATALPYLDFRFPDYNWREWNPELVDWLAPIEQVDWFKSTSPK